MAESSFRRIRPFKILALVLTVIAVVLTIISLAGPDWVSTTFFSGEVESWGLWWECYKVNKSFELCISSDWLAACVAMVFFALIGNVVTIACAVWGLCARRRLAYVISGIGCIASIIFLIICLIVYYVEFTKEVKDDPEYKAETTKFVFDWTYGLAWSAVCVLIGAAIFFFIRVKEEQDAQPMKSAFGREMPPSFYNNKA